ncbi:unnamed protein product [Moneuplotes crassus]|uniref:Uncharacterized protein n=1 Tax=Euplotes crassus TaxID=5936 RepID=A0AAD1USK8_EUPCR|nr:unnamed protein product [Moneuplotes crassus]
MRKAYQNSKSLREECSDIWNDGDLTVNEEKYEGKAAQLPNYTQQFTNTLKDNKGKVKSEDLSNYVMIKEFHQQLSVKEINIQPLDGELELNLEQQEREKENLKSYLTRTKVDKTACTRRENVNFLSSLRLIPSSELLKLIY